MSILLFQTSNFKPFSNLDKDEVAKFYRTMSWEFESPSRMYDLLVGEHYGKNPESINAQIHEDRVKIGQTISSYLNLKPTDHVLEIGSGTGDMAASLAPQLQRLYCADVSSSFLQVAQKKCHSWPHVSFHHLKAFDLSFIQPNTLNAIYSHAVFIHLNLYDFYWYFKSFSSVLKENGMVYLDFLSSKNLDTKPGSHFEEHAQYYYSNKSSLPNLLCFHNPDDIISLAYQFHLYPEIAWSSSNGSVGLILRKISSPSWHWQLLNRLQTGFRLLKHRFSSQ